MKNMQSDFIKKRDEDRETNLINYVKQMLIMEKEIKGLREDMKLMTAEAKELQVDVKRAKKALTKLKYLAKAKQDDLDEEELVIDVLRQNGDIMSDIYELTAKGA